MALSLIDKGHSYNEVSDMTGISRRTLIRYNNERKGKIVKIREKFKNL